MKTPFLKTLLLLAFVSFAFSSCKKDDATPAVSDDEAADAVGEMVSTDFTGSTSDASVVSGVDGSKANGRIAIDGRTLTSSCGVLKDSSIIRTGTLGAISFTRSLDFAYTLACTNKVPQSVTLTLTGASTRTGIFVVSSGSSSGNFTLTGFPSDYTINGTWNRTETIANLLGTKTYTGNHQLTVTNVVVDKTTYAIKSGSATYTMTGVYGTTTYTHSGTITFLGSGSATLTVNGNNYTVNLLTGVVTKS